MPDSAKVKFVQENLAKFSIITFFKKYSYLHSSRNAAQEDLRKCLENISHTGKAKEANIAKSYLANLDNMFKSKLAEDFWRKLEIGQLEEKEKHNKKLIINVYREHDAISGLVTSEIEGLSQQRRVSSNDDVLSDLSNDNGLSNDDNLFNNDDNDDLSNDNNDDFSNGGKDKEYEGDVDVTDLCEPHVMEAETGKELTSDEWAEVHALVESYRLKIPKTRCLYNPLFYHIVDHSGQHGPTTKLLNQYMSSMRRSLPNVSFDLPSLSDGQDKFFDELFAAEDLQDIRASTPEQRTVKKLVYRINDAINCPNKDAISEYEHTMRNVIPFIDASIRDVPDYVIHYFESTLRATAIRRNSGGDPTERARMGYRVDVLIKFNGLHWSPDLGCGEVSGGLRRCSSAKEWMDTLKLGWELRDVWALAQDQLNGVDASALVVWGFTVVARTIRIYALTAAGGLFHLILAYEAPIPSSRWDICNTKIAYCTMLGFLQKLDATKKMLVDLNSERTKILCTGVKRKKLSALFCSPPITGSPAKKKKK